MDFSSLCNEYTFSTICVGFLLAAIGTLFFKRKSGNSQCPIAPFSFIENFKYLVSIDCPFIYLEIWRKLKTDIFRIGFIFSDWYVIADAEATRQVLLDGSSEKPSAVYTPFNKIFGCATMFSRQTKDPLWHKVRKGTAPAFSSIEVKRMNEICKSCLESWTEERLEPVMQKSKTGTFDPSIELSYLTFCVISEAGFEFVPCFEEFDEFHHSLSKCFKEFDFENPLRVLFGLFIPERRQAFKANEKVRNYASKVLDRYRKNPNKSKNNTIIKMIENNEFLSENMKIAEVLAYLVAGHDTTGFTLSNTLILLAKHPEKAEKLREDIISSASQEKSQSPGVNSKYLKYVIQESSRLMPVAATGVLRTTGKDHVVGNGSVTIPKNSIVWMPIMLQFRNEKYFENPDEFRPERWANATKEMTQALIPFIVGTRNCIGQRLANVELTSCLAELMAKYNFEIVKEGKTECFLTLKYSGFQLRASRIE